MKNPSRFDALDVVRGLAMLWMTVFHFCFDLANLKLIQQNFYTDPFWTVQRTAIVSVFLWCAGFSQAIVLQQGQSSARFWRRWGQIAGCAALVTIGSMLMFPKSFIYFGVLHGMAVMLIIVRFTAHGERSLWLAGAVALFLPSLAAWGMQANVLSPQLNAVPWNILGLISQKPITEDYVPILPWLGIMWWGMASGQWWLRHPEIFWQLPLPLQWLKPVAFLGRWSLTYYMLHQPVILAGLWVWMRLTVT
jgi:uncharacterized membrane protein